MLYIIQMVNKSAMRNVARWLLAQEAAMVDPSGAKVQAALFVCEKLRIPLSRLSGTAGYSVLVGRALALAKAEYPSLVSWRIREDGSLEVPGPAGQGRDTEEIQKAGAALVAQLLELLATFVGEILAMRLVRDVWPDAPYELIDIETEKP